MVRDWSNAESWPGYVREIPVVYDQVEFKGFKEKLTHIISTNIYVNESGLSRYVRNTCDIHKLTNRAPF